MRCHICNAPLKNPKFDKVTHKAKPCSVCDFAIFEAVLELEHQEIVQLAAVGVADDPNTLALL